MNEVFLDKLAKEKKIDQLPENCVWAEVPRNYCFSKSDVERAVDIVLGKVGKEIEEAKYCAALAGDDTDKVYAMALDNFEKEFKKRLSLVAKKEAN